MTILKRLTKIHAVGLNQKMPKVIFNLRIEKDILVRLHKMATCQGITVSDFIRQIIDGNIKNGYPLELKIMAQSIVKSLRQPFAYIKPLKENAMKERVIRENLAQAIEEVFKLR